MSLNFLKTYLPLLPCHKRVAPFRKQKVSIPNPQLFIQKMQRLRAAHSKREYHDKVTGALKEERTLEVISDFDYTLTKHLNPFANHSYCDVIFGAFSKNQHMPAAFRDQLISNYLLFGPYETDSSITFEQKVSLIDALYKNQLALFKKHKITLKMVDQVTRDCQIIFRAFTQQLLKQLAYEQIPLYIVSGGVSDMIYSIMKGIFHNMHDAKITPFQQKILQNISIHSNELQFWTPKKQVEADSSIKQQFLKFRKPLIHSFNKYRIMGKLPIKNYEDYNKPLLPDHSPPDCILLGDLVSDIYMSRAHPHSTILSVFYAKEGEFDQRAIAQRKFDMIIEADGSHRMVLELIKIIKGQKQRTDWMYINDANPHLQERIRWI